MKVGVFLARMQPLHNAHLWLIEKALEENDRVYIVLGSENKIDMVRNPFGITLRKKILRECFDKKTNRKLHVFTLPDWSTEDDVENAKTWGRYFYYNVVSRIGQKHFSIYYSDDPSTLDSWFKGIEIEPYVHYRTFERTTMFDGLSATKIRKAFVDGDKAFIERYCPPSVVSRFDYLALYYRDVLSDPTEDFSME